MQKSLFFSSILTTIILSLAWAEEITFSTYYPSPYGVYKEMKVNYLDFDNVKYSEEAPLIMPEDVEGRICYDTGATNGKIFKYHNGTQWLPLGGGAGGYWTLTGDDKLYPNKTTYNVGIGTASPVAALTVEGAIARPGTTLSPNILYGDNASTHINLASSGGVTGISGQDYNDCLVLGGTNNRALSNYAIVVGGNNNKAYRDYTFIGGGRNNETNGSSAVILGGYGNRADQDSVVLGGSVNRARSPWSIVPGGKNNSSGVQGVILGGELNFSNYSSTSLGRKARSTLSSFVWADYSVDQEYYGGPYTHASSSGTFSIRAAGGVYYDASRKWDIAEEMLVLKEDNIQEAEIVSLAGNDILGKSKKAYDENLVGVVTSSRTTSLHLQTLADPPSDELEKRYITLAGRAYVKVNNENGPLKVGDAITSSSTPGVGMKATQPCKIIGYAMEDKKFSEDTEDEILVFVNLSYYVPEAKFKQLKARIEKLKLILAEKNN